MRLSALEILTAVTFCGLIAALVWLVYIVFRKDNYTREKFAFASLTAFSGMVTSVLAAMADKQTLLGEIVNFVRGVLGKAPQPEPARVADHVLMILVLLIVAHFILRLYDNWPGAISTRQYDQTRYHEAAPFLSESLHEAQRILKRAPAPKIVDRTQQGRFYSALEPPQFSLAWHIEVRDLICLRSPSYEIDRNDGWHDQARCWVGRNRKTGGIVAVKCTEQQPPLTELEEFIAYVNRIGQGDPQTATELILAVRMLKELKS